MSNIRTTSHRDITNLWSLYPASQQTLDIVLMLVQYWFTIYDAGPTLNQQWDNVSCLLGLMTPVCFTHEGGERPMSLKLQNQLCKVQNRRVFVLITCYTISYICRTDHSERWLTYILVTSLDESVISTNHMHNIYHILTYYRLSVLKANVEDLAPRSRQ